LFSLFTQYRSYHSLSQKCMVVLTEQSIHRIMLTGLLLFASNQIAELHSFLTFFFLYVCRYQTSVLLLMVLREKPAPVSSRALLPTRKCSAQNQPDVSAVVPVCISYLASTMKSCASGLSNCY